MPTNNTARRRRNELTLVNRHPRRRVDPRLLRRILRAALADSVFSTPPPEAPGARPSDDLRYELGCSLVGVAEITALNEQYLHHAGPTDVIAFDYGAPPDAAPGTPWLRGEVFICLDVASTQARQYHTTWQSELVRYAVHGLLHIRGYDDLTAPDRQLMKREEDRLVVQLGAQFRFSRLHRDAHR